jgi:hypothetical protein
MSGPKPEYDTVQRDTLASSSLSVEADIPADEDADAESRKKQSDQVEGIEDQVQDEGEVEAEEVVEAEGEEDEEARRRRVAEKLAQMGAVNPFSMPSLPLRKPSDASTPEKEVRAEPVGSPRKENKKDEDVASAIPPKSPLMAAPSPGHEETDLGLSGEVNEASGQAENLASSQPKEISENVTEAKQRKESVDVEDDGKY